MTNHVISGLIRRRREVAGDILDLLAKVDVLANDLDALDRALRVFDPDIQLDHIPALQVRPKADWAVKGKWCAPCSRCCVGLLSPCRRGN